MPPYSSEVFDLKPTSIALPPTCALHPRHRSRNRRRYDSTKYRGSMFEVRTSHAEVAKAALREQSRFKRLDPGAREHSKWSLCGARWT
jgi:hypothetical protein